MSVPAHEFAHFIATTIGWVFGARFVDRIGKGIRGAPRDALVADIAPSHLRGAAYGLCQSLDQVGAFIGPLLAIAFMVWLANDIKAVLWVGVVPALIAVTLLIVAVREPKPLDNTNGPRKHLMLKDVKRLPMKYRLVVALGAVFTFSQRCATCLPGSNAICKRSDPLAAAIFFTPC